MSISVESRDVWAIKFECFDDEDVDDEFGSRSLVHATMLEIEISKFQLMLMFRPGRNSFVFLIRKLFYRI